MIIVDAHLDLAYNAVNHGRNLRQTVAQIRAAENGRNPEGIATVSIPDLLAGGVGVVFGTLFVTPASRSDIPGEKVYHNAQQAHALAMAQLDYYHRLADEDERVCLVGSQADLEAVLQSHEGGERPSLGIVPLMEGADPIREPEEAELWYERGLRLIGPAWDDTRYADGAWKGSNRGLTKEGQRLLDVMADLGFILDITHLSEKASLTALERYEGTAVATHSNTRHLVPGERQLNDTQIRLLGERGGVIGVVLFNKFLRAGHAFRDPKEQVTLAHVAAHIDHICQVLGSADHVGIGSDFDGGFGAGDIPAELDTARDLGRIATHLERQGFDAADVAKVMGGNWLRILRDSLL